MSISFPSTARGAKRPETTNAIFTTISDKFSLCSVRIKMGKDRATASMAVIAKAFEQFIALGESGKDIGKIAQEMNNYCKAKR